MFNAVAIHANPSHRQVLYYLAVESRMLTLQRITDGYPTQSEMSRITGVPAPDLVLLDLADPNRSTECLQELQNRWPLVPVIGVGGTALQRRSLALVGIRHFLPFPTDLASFINTLAQTIRASHAELYPHLAAFVPAKAGCGASTVVLAASTSLAALDARRVLCIDADLRSGVLGLALDAYVRASTQGVLASIHDLDRFRWSNSVCRLFETDFLFSSGDAPAALPEWHDYFVLLSFVNGQYDHILVDLPELVNPATEEILRRAGNVFLVLTEETLCVRMAERRMADLLKWGVPHDRVSLLLNRSGKHAAPAAKISQSLDRPVAFRFPNNYPAVQSALQHGRWPLDPRSDIGRAYAQFAHALAFPSPEAATAPAGAEPARQPAGLTGLLRTLVGQR